MNSPLLLRHVFDVVIVDEAGQMTLPATIAPLLKARAFVLVRDKMRKCKTLEGLGPCGSDFCQLPMLVTDHMA